ncbi:hypothetical protein TPY_2669 [Sulfobacillus acidophilus TPY]|uniref:Uncharacterized protein n=1 Tax=Sulfobacillus acidophilus (strain ATCC 700253 / DSM 10332 / NAL) TaxID=679936 RepID=G8TV72_SULAD|nr:hypothetical protein TPY_2669 [Sulfobacillus acidophilus TPY]AEW04712.1 hypothetical protein Sulac_1212 [Sulfobacillus acidophilus DSM 10332]
MNQLGPLILKNTAGGITQGFQNLGHAVNLWLFSLPMVALLFLLYSQNVVSLLGDLGAWSTDGKTTQVVQQLHALVTGTPPPALPANWGSPWTPAWTDAQGVTHGLAGLVVTWQQVPLWFLVVIAIWAIGFTWGILIRRHDQASQTLSDESSGSATLWHRFPLLTPFSILVATLVLPWAIRVLFWHMIMNRVATSILHTLTHSLGVAPAMAVNPFWIWGALLGISGPHGIDLGKIPWAVALPIGGHVVGNILHGVMNDLQSSVLQSSVFRDVTNYLYGLTNAGIVVLGLSQVILLIWTAELVGASLLMSLTVLWLITWVLDVWSPDALLAGFSVLGRSALVVLSAWVWVLFIAVLGGGPHGPLGLPPLTAGFTIILTTLVTAIFAAGGAIYWAIPTWLYLRRTHQVVTAQWMAWKARIAAGEMAVGALVTEGGNWAAHSAQRLHSLGLRGIGGGEIATAGTAAAQSLQTLATDWTTWGQRLRAAGLERQAQTLSGAGQAGWTASEQQAQTLARRLDPFKGPAGHPGWDVGGWATQSPALASLAGNEGTWEALDAGRWQWSAWDPSTAQEAAQAMQQALTQAGWTEHYEDWVEYWRRQFRQQAEAVAAQKLKAQKTPLSPAEYRRRLQEKTDQIVAQNEAGFLSLLTPDQWERYGKAPTLQAQGTRVIASGSPAGWQYWAPILTQWGVDQARERYRAGIRERWTNGVWVAVPDNGQAPPVVTATWNPINQWADEHVWDTSAAFATPPAPANPPASSNPEGSDPA